MPTNTDHFCPHCGSPIERMLSINSSALLIDCSAQKIRDLVNNRIIGHAKIEGMIRIPYSELRKIIKYIPSMQDMVEEALL